MDQKKPRQPNWTERDKIILVQQIIPKQDALFGRFKGSSSGSRTKDELWDEVLSSFNAESDIKRTKDQIQKQYENLKTRAKAKHDELTRPKTGGGERCTSPTPSQKLILEHLQGRPNLTGLTCPLDTEDPNLNNFHLEVFQEILQAEDSSCTGSVPEPSASTLPEAALEGAFSIPERPRKKKKSLPCPSEYEEVYFKAETRRAEAEEVKLKLESQLLEIQIKNEMLKGQVLEAKLKNVTKN